MGVAVLADMCVCPVLPGLTSGGRGVVSEVTVFVVWFTIGAAAGSGGKSRGFRRRPRRACAGLLRFGA